MPPFQLAFEGCGPRGAAIIARFVAEKSLGRMFSDIDVDITVFERQAAVNIARGNAWQDGCDGAINTSVPGLPAGLDGLDPDLAHNLDLAARVLERFVANKDAMLAKYKVRNPLVAALFHKAFRPDGTLDTTKAFASRGDVGEVIRDCFNGVVDYVASGKVAGLTITVRPEHEVVKTDYRSDAEKYKLFVKRAGQSDTETFIFDDVVHCGGVPLAAVVSGKAKPNTYNGLANYDLIKSFLTEHDMLDASGKLKLGKRALFAGEGLSGLDFLGIACAFNPAFVLDLDSRAGYYVDKDLAPDYKHAFTFVSSGTGRPAPPRLSHTEDWQGVENPILTTKEMHTLRLVPGLDWTAIAIACMNHNIAHTLGGVPLDTHLPLPNSQAYMEQYHAQTEEHLNNSGAITQISLKRQALQSFFYGRGFEKDAKQAERDLEQFAPLTREGRGGWLMVAATGHEMSKKAKQGTEENRDFFWYRDYIRFEAAASPVPIQHAASKLYLAEVATNLSANFKDINDTGDEIRVGDDTYDVLFEPEGINRAADKVITSLKGQVLMENGVPTFAKGRRYENAKGPINVIDAGAGGWGIPIRGEIGGMANERWAGDTVDLGNTIQYGELLAKQLLLTLYTRRWGLKSTIDDLYRKVLPSEADHDAETEKSRSIYEKFREQYACIVLCKALPGDSVKFRKWADQIASDETRPAFVALFKTRVEQNKKLLPDFTPAKRDRYEDSFSDFTKKQLADMTALAEEERLRTAQGGPELQAALADAMQE